MSKNKIPACFEIQRINYVCEDFPHDSVDAAIKQFENFVNNGKNKNNVCCITVSVDNASDTAFPFVRCKYYNPLND